MLFLCGEDGLFIPNVSKRREGHRACLDGRVDSAYDFMVNEMKLVNSRVRFFFTFLWMEKGLEIFCKIYEEF